MDSQFDAFVRAYENDEYLPFRRHIEAHSFFKALGSTEGAEVLDVGCGAGLYTRRLQQRGAARVLGLDAARNMIEYAREREAEERLGLEYVIDDVSNAARYGAFDVVTAIYVLPYAETEEKLHAMCKGICDALRPGGRLVAMPISPRISYSREDFYKPYGFTIYPVNPEHQGLERLPDTAPIRLLTHVPEIPLDVIAYHWSAETQERVLREAGFSSVTWQPVEVSPEGVQRYGADIWQTYLERPHSSPLVAVK